MTKLEASLTQLMNKAASGDLKAMNLLAKMATRFPELVKDEDMRVRIEFVDPEKPHCRSSSLPK